jgi:hypothetical protein
MGQGGREEKKKRSSRTYEEILEEGSPVFDVVVGA